MTNDPRGQAETHSSPVTKKLESLIELYAELDRQAPAGNIVPRLRMAASDFYQHYFYLNRPVIVEGLMADWEAPTKWTLGWLKDQFGDSVVTVQAGRSSDPLYEQHFRATCRNVRFGDFLSVIEGKGDSNDIYLVGRNHLLHRLEFQSLFEDIRNPSGFLDGDKMNHQYIQMWIGSSGTITPLHHDAGSVFFGQVTGRKHFKFISPFHLPSLSNEPATCYSPVTLDGPLDLARFPAMQDVPVTEALVGPGDFLFIPVAWWHWVRSLDLSISLTFKNFLFRHERISWRYK